MVSARKIGCLERQAGYATDDPARHEEAGRRFHPTMNSNAPSLWAPRLAPRVGTAAFFRDPYPTWAELHADGGIGYCATDKTWLLTRYEDVVASLKDTRLSKQTGAGDPSPLSRSMLFQDAPDHARLRNAVSDWFTSARVRSMEQRIAEIADGLIDRMAKGRQADFMAAFAVPLPVAVIADLLGVRQADQAALHAWSRPLSQTGGSQEAGHQAKAAALESMAAYFERLIDHRAVAPGDDLVSGLVARRDEGERLSRREILGTCMLLLIAGHETTVNLLGNGLSTLLAHRDEYARLRADPALLPSAIEEVLRYESPVQRGTFRVATEAFAIRGVTIPPGQTVAPLIGAANRDPDVFPNPHRFDISRSPNRHIAFGVGMHSCLGAMLARAEARIGFERVFERLGEIRLATPRRGVLVRRVAEWFRRPASPTACWQQSTMVRGLEALQVEW